MIEDTSHSSSSNFSDADQVDQLLESYVDKSKQDVSQPQPSTSKHSDKPSESIEKVKTVLKTLGKDYFEPLPEGWLKAMHFSGMPIYLHRESRVCTMSKPYYLGDGSVRSHEIPISAIPCLEYRREKAKLDQKQETGAVVFESVGDHKREKWLVPEEVKEYCDKLFEFDEVTIRKFKTWADRRKFISSSREEKQRPSLPDDTKLITCPSTSRKGFVMNPAGKSSVCILHEFVQHKEKIQPKYIYKELENPTLPYEATALINDTPYGIGYGKSKKDAKEDAAKKTIQILIPEYKDKIETTTSKHSDNLEDLKFFDTVKIDDERVYDLCTKAGLQTPYQILMEWKNRNAGFCDTEITQALQPQIKHYKSTYFMKVGQHEVNVVCKNSREGKQMAAQAILKKIHPQVTYWSGMLLMYGRGSCKTSKQKKEEEQKITELQATAKPNEPNWAILKKLREEMMKLP